MGIKRRGFRYGLASCIWTFNGSRSISASVMKGFTVIKIAKSLGFTKDQNHETNYRDFRAKKWRLPVICNEMSEVRWESADTNPGQNEHRWQT